MPQTQVVMCKWCARAIEHNSPFPVEYHGDVGQECPPVYAE
jgi:hypothetical protein